MIPLSQWFDTVAQSALSTRATLQATYDIARVVLQNDIRGDFVECGVFKGAQAAAMALAIMEPVHYWEENRETARAFSLPWPPRRVHLFDSFEGIPQAGPQDREFLEAGHEAGLSACSLEDCKANMKGWGIPDELLVWHPGPFSETITVGRFFDGRWQGIQDIALLRLDCDLYESTRDCMANLYPLVSPGGWVICDDYSLSGARKAVDEVTIPAPCYWVKQ
jgi:O-methyltransferase/8-demethyl-8-(2,3-dimethoxy-alpha-L-rhamnosyl)tetracenomycin-C 4'-O-methyltransferase